MLPPSLPNLGDLAGTILADKYRLIEPLGCGGMGYVYRAEQLSLGRTVAVKLLRRDLIDTRFDWFRAEALAASRINHPHAVSVYDFGVTESGTPYLVMELILGAPLTELLTEGAMPATRAAGIACQVLSALDEAHACGVIHCDLTAANVIVQRLRDGSDFAKVIDFGLARLIAEQPGDGPGLGTAEYAAPEQIQGTAVGAPADLYATGILLYEMITGRTPFAGASPATILERHLREQPLPPHEVTSACPTALSEIVMEALRKDPSARPADARAMREAIQLATPTGSDLATVTTHRPKRRPTTDPGLLEMVRHPPVPAPHTTRLTDRPGATQRFIGRADDLAVAADFFRGSRREPMLAVVGERGIGKARLIVETATRLEGEVTTFLAAADPSGLRLPWYPILSLLERLLGLAPGFQYQELSQAAARIGLPDRDVPGLAELFGVSSPANELELAVRRREAHASALRALLTTQRRFPRAVLAFVDFDSYDRPSRELIRGLSSKLDGSNLRLVVTTKEPPTRLTAVHVLKLAGLAPTEGRELLQATVTREVAVPNEEATANITRGRPAMIEQLGGWLTSGSCAADIPSQLADLVSVRVAHLPAAARRVLQTAAIHGTVAPKRLVEVGLTEHETQLLNSGEWTGLIHQSEDRIVFAHELVAMVVEASTPTDISRRLHRRALSTLPDHTHAAIRAHHAERAGDIAGAYGLFLEAGHDAVRRFDDTGAALWYGRALTAARELHARGITDSATKVVAASALLAEVLRYCDRIPLALGVLDEAAGFSPSHLERSWLARQRGMCTTKSSPEDALGHFDAAIGLSLRAGDREHLCQSYLDKGRLLSTLGRMDEAREELSQAADVITGGLGLAQANGPSRLWRVAMMYAELELEGDNPKLAHEVASAALGMSIRLQSSTAQGRLRALLARICERLGDAKGALEHRSAAIDALRSLGDRRSTAELLIQSVETQTIDTGSDSGEWANEPRSVVRLARRLVAELDLLDGMERPGS